MGVCVKFLQLLFLCSKIMPQQERKQKKLPFGIFCRLIWFLWGKRNKLAKKNEKEGNKRKGNYWCLFEFLFYGRTKKKSLGNESNKKKKRFKAKQLLKDFPIPCFLGGISTCKFSCRKIKVYSISPQSIFFFIFLLKTI